MTETSNPTPENDIAVHVTEAFVINSGQLELPEERLLSIGKEIHEATDKQLWATALIALATRLQEVPGARPATEQVTALAAVALGDVQLNGALCRALYSNRR